MKKLLLVLLIPVLVLGVMGCGDSETGKEVDQFIQTLWRNDWTGSAAANGVEVPAIGADSNDADMYTLIFTANQLTVKIDALNLSIPYTLEFDYLNTSSEEKRFITLPATAVNSVDEVKAFAKQVKGLEKLAADYTTYDAAAQKAVLDELRAFAGDEIVLAAAAAATQNSNSIVAVINRAISPATRAAGDVVILGKAKLFDFNTGEEVATLTLAYSNNVGGTTPRLTILNVVPPKGTTFFYQTTKVLPRVGFYNVANP